MMVAALPQNDTKHDREDVLPERLTMFHCNRVSLKAEHWNCIQRI